MAPLAVDPAALDGTGAAVVSTGESLGSVISTLTNALGGCSGMAGEDPAGAAFGRSYDKSAPKLLQAMATTRNGLCGLGYGIRMSAHNYSMAESMSNVTGHGEPLPAPHPAAPVSVGATPSAVGDGVGAPAGWGWVAPFIGMIWPNGDSAKLRAAAGAWISAGTNFEVTEITRGGGPMGCIGAQQIPEGPAIASAFGDATRSAAGILQQSVSIAGQLGTYAAKIDQVHAAILDLLSRICDPTTGLKEVWEFLTDQDEDEIKKIANDIRVVVNQFTTEVDALRQQIAAEVSEAETILTNMGRWADKEWDHLLHGTPVGRAVNQIAQFDKGFIEEAGGLVKDSWTYGPLRGMVDPQGWYDSWKQMIGGMAPLVGLGGDHAPGVADAWKTLGKNAVHWDEWKTNPAEAAGKSTFDIASLFVPGGGEGAAAAKGAHAAVDAAEATAKTAPRDLAAVPRALGDAPKPHIPAPEPRPPHVDAPPHEKPPAPHDEPAPHSEVPGGRPEPAPAPKDGAPHPDSMPHSPVESRPPVTHEPAHAPDPRPTVEPSDPGHGPPPPGGSPPPPGQGPLPPQPHSPMSATPPGGGPAPAEPPAMSAPPSGNGMPPAEPPAPTPISSGDGSMDLPPHQAPTTSSGEAPPPAAQPHQMAPSTPSGDGHLPPIDEPQHAPTAPSGEDDPAAHDEPQPVAAPSESGHPPADGDHSPASVAQAPTPVAAGAHPPELGPRDASTAQPRSAGASGRVDHSPDGGKPSERTSAQKTEPRGGRPDSPPTSWPRGDGVDHAPKTAPHVDKPSGLGDGGRAHLTEHGDSGAGHGGGHGDAGHGGDGHGDGGQGHGGQGDGHGSHGGDGGHGGHGGHGDGADKPPHDPVHSHEPSGDGWERLGDEPRHANYGEPQDHYWQYDHDPTDPSRIHSDVAKLIKDPDAPFGRDPHGNAYTQHEYEERFNKEGPEGQRWYNFASDDGALVGTKVAFNSLERYRDFYGNQLDRIGDNNGKYLGVMEHGKFASWEERAMHVDSLDKPLNSYAIEHLPEEWKIEVSEIEPAVGQPGGAMQVRILDHTDRPVDVETLLKRGVLGP